MTVRELLTTVDRLRPNAFADQEKLQFLNTVEGRIYREILDKAGSGLAPGYDERTCDCLQLCERGMGARVSGFPEGKIQPTLPTPQEDVDTATEEAPETENVQKEKPVQDRGGFLFLQRKFRPFCEGEEERELAVPIPYTDIYIYYLTAMIDFYSGDSGRYNDSMAMFNRAWEDYAAHYRATHKPKQTKLTGMLPHRKGMDRRDWF